MADLGHKVAQPSKAEKPALNWLPVFPGKRQELCYWKKWSEVKWSEVKWSEVDQSCPMLCDPMDTRLLRPWDFLGKSTGVGCHFFLQGGLPDPGIELKSLISPALTNRLFTTVSPGNPTLKVGRVGGVVVYQTTCNLLLVRTLYQSKAFPSLPSLSPSN